MSSNLLNMLAFSPEQEDLLALLLEEQALSIDPATAIAPRPNATEHPLSFAQGRLWFLHQMAPTSPLYNIPLALRFQGTVDASMLARTLGEIVRRHAVLRATFQNVAGQPKQVIAAPQPQPLPLLDLSLLPSATREAALHARIREAAGEPFDLAQGPLLRTTLLRVTATDHVLLILFHHIVADGLSYGVFMQELAALYAAFVRGQPSPLPELDIQFADFAHWQRAWLQGDVLAEQLADWRQQLAGAPAFLELPTDFPRPPVQTYWGDRQSLVLPPALSEALRALSRQQAVTLYTTLLAAWQILLARYTRQDDIVVGAPVANRNRPGLEALIGLFVNTLALRTDLSANPTVSELLAQVGETVLRAYDHQELPFEQLVEVMQPVRNLSHSPLFQVMFNYQPARVTDIQLPNVTVRTLEQPSGIAKFDLTLTIEEAEKTLILALDYNTDLFKADTIQRLLGHYQTLLTAMVEQPEQRVATLPLLTAAEAEQVLVVWNDTYAEYPADLCIHQLFESQAARTPDAVALVCGEQTRTYRELNEQANRLAHHLRSLRVGVSSGEMLVGLCVERSTEMIVAMLAILKAGGAYVPLDPAMPKARLAYMLQDAEAPVLVTQAHLLAQLRVPPGCQIADCGLEEARLADQSAIRNRPIYRWAQSPIVICLDRDWPQIAMQDSANPMSGVDADHLAYVIYTSGSTGRPKGALNTHRGLGNLLHALQATHQLTAADKTLQTTAFSFDVATAEIFWPLLNGASLVLTRPDGQRDSAYLVEMIRRHRITTLHMAPALLQALMEEPGIESCTTLKRVIAAGEALPFSLQQRFFTRLDNAELHNLYGPTETAVYVTAWQCQRDSALTLVPIGRPLANTQAYILDAQQQPVPIGVPGELYIGGVQVGRGYHKRPELTQERFIPNPLRAQSRARLYKTGDLARWLPDGNIEYLGRLDHQVKIRGFRIELGEIENTLTQHPGVLAAVVLAISPDRGTATPPVPGDHKRLVAYVVPQPAAGVERSELGRALQDHLRAHLPDYMLPTAFLYLDSLPLTPNGKVDRTALAALSPDGFERSTAFVAPRTGLETTLAQIWATVLPLDAAAQPAVGLIGIHDNFFELGGHSLLITQIMARVEETFQVKVPLQAFFETPTIAQLALLVERAQTEPPTEVAGINKVARDDEAQLLANLDQLSDAEVEALLSNMLN